MAVKFVVIVIIIIIIKKLLVKIWTNYSLFIAQWFKASHIWFRGNKIYYNYVYLL